MEVTIKRESLTRLLQGIDGQTAESFFERIMNETSTQITWPQQLKPHARSKKDPNIKICGSWDGVVLAKEKIMKVLGPKNNRVIMKMDVSFTHHSHLIGKCGKNVKSIMEENNCHIHFPDSNRNSAGEKSNQVSLTGDPIGVENARSRIRDLLPVIISFELPPPSNVFQPVPDSSDLTLKLIEFAYGIFISFHHSNKVGSVTVQVRCCQKQFSRHKTGIICLMEYLTQKSIELPVVIHTRILPPNHSFVMGNGSSNIHRIMQKTGTQIIFPCNNLGDCNQDRSTVTIWGTIDGAYDAWREVMGSLPVTLIFDLKEGEEFDTASSTILQSSLPNNISILLKPKQKQNTKTVILKGAECNFKLLLQIRQQLLRLGLLNFPPDKEEIELASHLISYPTDSCFNKSLNDIGLLSSFTIEQLKSLLKVPSNPLHFPSAMQREEYSAAHQPLGRILSDSTFINSGSFSQLSSPSTFFQPRRETCDLASLQTEEIQCPNFKEYRSWSLPEFCQDNCRQEFNGISSSNLTKKNIGSIGCERKCRIASDYDNKKVLATKAMQRQIECAQVPSGSWAGYGFSQSMPTTLIKQRQQEENLFHDSLFQRCNEEDWSSTKPLGNWPSNLDIPDVDSRSSRNCIYSTSNYLEAVLPPEKLKQSSDFDLTQLLCNSGLTSYVDKFTQQEIWELSTYYLSLHRPNDKWTMVDLATFLTMSDQDLQELGVPYGARQKMSLIISGINRQCLNSTEFKPFLLAPGAERVYSCQNIKDLPNYSRFDS